MKRLLAILVVLTLVVGTVFAADLSATVFGHVNIMEGDNLKDSKIRASGGMDRMRIDGSGSPNDNFGGYIRVQTGDFVVDSALAWWKPIDQFKLTIGKNSDGFWSKEGITGWGFNQMPYDSGIAIGSGNIWGWGETVNGLQTRFAFAQGFDDWGALLEITPFDLLAVNVAIPFMKNDEFKEVFKAIYAQVSVNLDFGNIAFTYRGASEFKNGALYAYFGGSFGDLGLDFSASYHMDTWDSGDGAMFIGLGLKYAAGAFGIKFRTAVGLPIADGQDVGMLFDLLPSFAISDNLSVFLNAGLGISGADHDVGFFINPYLRVGAEWGPTFYFGFQLSIGKDGDGNFTGGGDDGKSKNITWAVPISLMVSF